MAEPMPNLEVSQQAAVDRSYQPLAPLAVAAGVVAAVTAVVTLTVVGSGLLLNRPVLVPELILPAVVGGVLALAGLYQVSQSEGTRAGRQLAAVSGWVCLLCGVGYAAYLGANDLAVRRQVGDAATLWFNDLKAGDVNGAYHRTLSPTEQGDLQPGDTDFESRHAAQLVQFRQNELIRLVERAGDAAKVENLGPKSMVLEGDNTWRVSHNFLVTTPEGKFKVVAGLAGASLRATGRRVWRVLAGGETRIESRELTDYGRLQIDLQRDGTQFALGFLAAARKSSQFDAYLLTQPLPDRVAYTVLTRLSGAAGGGWGGVLGSPALALASPEARDAALPGRAGCPSHKDYSAGTLLQFAAAPATDAERRERTRMAAGVFRDGAVFVPMSSNPQVNLTPHIRLTPTKVELAGPVEVQMPLPSGQRVGGTLLAELNAPAVLAKAEELRAGSGTPLALDVSEARDWRVTRLETAMQAAQTQPRPGRPR